MFFSGVTTQKYPTKALTAATTLTASESGKTFYLSTAGGFTVTLPAAADGLRFTFVVAVAPTTAYIIDSAEDDNIVGIVLASSGGNEDSETTGADNVQFTANTSTVSDEVTLQCFNGVWYAKGYCDAAGAITFEG